MFVKKWGNVWYNAKQISMIVKKDLDQIHSKQKKRKIWLLEMCGVFVSCRFMNCTKNFGKLISTAHFMNIRKRPDLTFCIFSARNKKKISLISRISLLIFNEKYLLIECFDFVWRWFSSFVKCPVHSEMLFI